MKNPMNPMLNPTSNMIPTTSSMPATSMAASMPGMAQGMNGNMGSPIVSSYGQTTAGMSTMMPPQNTSGGQPVPEEKLTSRQQRKKQELMDHKAAGEQNLEREEKLEISGKDARYMMMQKLARGAPVRKEYCILKWRNGLLVKENSY